MTALTSSAVRAHLVRALEAKLVGPYAEREELERAPSRTYRVERATPGRLGRSL